ncbi:MAG: hypothetical protein Q4F81_03630 [Eubacteriales bacterium]|nr:hypothetical protein [Eubacteriales bacterium]
MDVRGKLVGLICRFCGGLTVSDITPPYGYENLADYLITNGVTVQEWIPQAELPWMGGEIAKLCIRYMEEYADFHGYASSKKVKAHIVRLLELEKDGRIAILPQPPKGE